MIRRSLFLALLLSAVGCGGQSQEEAPRTLPVETIEIRLQLRESVEGLEDALRPWAQEQGVQVVVSADAAGPPSALVEIDLEELRQRMVSEEPRPFPQRLADADWDLWGMDDAFHDGQLFAVPWRLDLVGLGYRASTGTRPPRTWQELASFTQTRGPMALQNDHLHEALLPLIWTAGGAWLDSLEAAVQIPSDAAREALSFLERLVASEQCLEMGELEEAFLAGRVRATVLNLGTAVRWAEALPEGDLVWGPFPAVDGERGAPVVWLRPRAWILPSGGPHQDLAADLARHLALDETCAALLAPRYLPASRSMAVADEAILERARTLLNSSRSAPAIESWPAFVAALEQATAATTSRRRSPGAALDEADQAFRSATVRAH